MPISSPYNRLAGQRLDPLRALSDGVFAVAMTLLVLDLRIPRGWAAADVASLVMVHHGSSRWDVAAAAATMWCGSFAGLHLFWALGGSVGLASSAGRDLAVRRPASFVIFGLYGTALLLVVGILIIAVTQRPRAARRLRRGASVLLAVVGVGLVLRGLALELLLATNAAGLRANVGPLETYWSLILWNPWFVVGGALFIATAIRASRAGFVRGESQ